MTVIPASGLVFEDLPGRASADPLADVDTASSVRIINLRRSAGRTAHRHPLSEEIIVVTRGSGAVWIDGTLYSLQEGDVVTIPVDAAHATIPDEGIEMTLACFFPHPDLSANLVPTDIEVGQEDL